MNFLKENWLWMLIAGAFAYLAWMVARPYFAPQPGQVWIYHVGGDDPFTPGHYFTNIVTARSNGYVKYLHITQSWFGPQILTNEMSSSARVFIAGSTRIK